MNKNRIEGAAKQGERANSREALVIKATARAVRWHAERRVLLN